MERLVKYTDLEWKVFNSGEIDGDTTLGAIVADSATAFCGLPLQACKDIVAAHNASLGTLYARSEMLISSVTTKPTVTVEKQNQESIDAATAEVKKEEVKDSGFADNTDAVHSNSHEETGDDLGAEIVIRFTAGNICSSNDFGKDHQYFKSFDDLVRSLINSEGLFGIVNDDYEIISIRAVKESKTLVTRDVQREETGIAPYEGSSEWLQDRYDHDQHLISQQSKIITNLCLAIDPDCRSQPETEHKVAYAKRTRKLLRAAQTGIAVLRNLLRTVKLEGGAQRSHEILEDIDAHLGSEVPTQKAPTDTAVQKESGLTPAAPSRKQEGLAARVEPTKDSERLDRLFLLIYERGTLGLERLLHYDYDTLNWNREKFDRAMDAINASCAPTKEEKETDLGLR